MLEVLESMCLVFLQLLQLGDPQVLYQQSNRLEQTMSFHQQNLK